MKKNNKALGHAGIAASITASLDLYLQHLDGEPAHNLYELVIGTVEKALITDVLARTGNNQSEAAQMLGINRNTLRAKIDKHAIKVR